MINLLGWPEGLAVPLITQPLGVTSTPQEEMKISCAARNAQTDNGEERYDGQVHKHTRKRQTIDRQAVIWQEGRGTHLNHNTNTGHTALCFFFFLPSCRRWWMRPWCSLCCLPPPPRTQSLQTWQTTGSYCEAERAQSRLCQSKFLSSAKQLSLLKISLKKSFRSVRTGRLWLEQPITCHNYISHSCGSLPINSQLLTL